MNFDPFIFVVRLRSELGMWEEPQAPNTRPRFYRFLVSLQFGT